MSVVALGACMFVAAAAQRCKGRAPRLLSPLLNSGQRSYEVYLTHMFVVFALFAVFVRHREPMIGVPVLFVAVIVDRRLLGEVGCEILFGADEPAAADAAGDDGPEFLGSVLEARESRPRVLKTRSVV
jgi:hypothetical protein